MYKAKTLDDIQMFYDKHLTKHTPRKSSSHYQWILKLMHPKPSACFLDVACGAGFMVDEARKAGLKAYGIDASPVAIELAKKNAPDTHLIIGDGENLPWSNDYFDYVTSLGSLEHYLHPEIGIREIRRVLRADGLSCILLPNSFSLKDIFRVIIRGGLDIDEQGLVERVGTKNDWVELIETNGLRIIKSYKFNEVHSLFEKGTLKIKSLRKFTTSVFRNLICPFNLAEHFVFLAIKK